MGRLCERPGCSEPASVAYGMRAEDLVFWLDALRADDDQSSGVLCQRHADSMVVPRHWTLDDLRDPVPRLFRAPVSTPAPIGRSRRRRPINEGGTEQLLLDGGVPASLAATAEPHVETVDLVFEPAMVEAGSLESAAIAPDIVASADVMDETDPDEAQPWSPMFDESDDLGGLLAARSPLLARAFRGDDRPRSG